MVSPFQAADESFPLDPKLLGDILTDEVWAEICETGYLQGEPLLKAWRRMEMQGEPPDRLLIQIRKSDLERLVAEIKREQKLARRAKRG